MSFLEELNRSKTRLKPTISLVTHADGSRFMESGATSSRLPEQCHGFVVDTKPDDVPALVLTHLYLGSQDCADPKVLQEYCIKNVLSIGIPAHNQSEVKDITYKFQPCLDVPDTCLADILNDCLEYIDNARAHRANVLVHCNAGVSRSAAVVIGYLIQRCGMSYDDAYAHVKRLRSAIRPNDGFVAQLKQLRPGTLT